jgi:hypothetical protein
MGRGILQVCCGQIHLAVPRADTKNLIRELHMCPVKLSALARYSLLATLPDRFTCTRAYLPTPAAAGHLKMRYGA